MNLGDIIVTNKKTGKYIGEITAIQGDMLTVRILAVLNHPRQGDLHNPLQADVPFFHERKALAYREQTNIQARIAKAYEGEIPDYKDSLKKAFQTYKEKLKTEPEEAYNKLALQALDSIAKEYTLMYSITFD
ncbi:kinase-associated lipoprotein B [Lederbergia galactosidilytica]|uniref:Kinase n=1 Tax=Lederbergia galactosidilytica TaxID=217031 RepID=A0A177ZKH3_9BACI|nr:kinase-associated lipoprotein B [Lederbergia galactosidilytica]KRG15224.1 kinase [Virgibacillus soli]OAK67810.1 kinase [Lederbergia galactosidilytica]